MNKLLVGAAKISISPTPDMLPFPENPIYGVVAGKREHAWVRKEIHTRVIAIDNGEKRLVFIVQEHGKEFNAETVKDLVTAKYGIPRKCIFISGTHNHSATPPIDLNETEDWGEPVPEIRYRYSRYVIDQTVIAVGEAIKNMRPARFGYGKGNSYVNVNRDERLENGRYVEGKNFERPSDKTLAVLKFEDYQGKLIAVMMNYSVHSVMAFRVVDKDGNRCVSGDLAGEVSEFIEKAFEADGTVAMWTIASGGNQNPLFCCYHNYFPDGSYEMSKVDWDPLIWDIAHHLGMRQGMDTLRILKGITQLKDELPIKIVDRVLTLPGVKVEGFTRPMVMDANLIDDSVIHHVDADPIHMTLKLVMLGGLAVLGMNCELMCEIGMRLKEKVAPQELMIISVFDKGAGGRYFVDTWGYEHKTFAYYRNKVKDACFEEKMNAMVLDMFKEISKK